MPTKPKTQQPITIESVQKRDCFQTPNYATEILLPFIPKHIKTIWECASGKGKISNVLKSAGYEVFESDLNPNENISKINFLSDTPPCYMINNAIITNPPFSLKKHFYLKCKEYGVPFALLIPADYSGWLIDALRFDLAEKIIPSRRIDYLTPNGKEGKESASQFHSLWLTWGFDIGKSETFIELTKEMKMNV